MEMLEQNQRFMIDDSTLNENLMTRRVAASHLDIISPKSQLDMKPSQMFSNLKSKSPAPGTPADAIR
jgi:hypothetical protein